MRLPVKEKEQKKSTKCLVSSKIMSNFAEQKGKTITPKPNAKIAQLVEHDLAKVGVAGSSPVFRSREQ